MAFYSYRCSGGHEFDARSPVGERHEMDCPDCGEAAELVFSSAGSFYIAAQNHPWRPSHDEVVAGRFWHGGKYVEKWDVMKPYQDEAVADVEERVGKADALREKARVNFERSVDYIPEGPARDDAREEVQKELDRKGVRR